jgi:hypothetical protein
VWLKPRPPARWGYRAEEALTISHHFRPVYRDS